MKKSYLYYLFIVIVVFISGCTGANIDKESTLEAIKQRLGSFKSYSCDVYQECPELEGTTCQKDFLEGKLIVDKDNNKLRFEVEEVQRDDTGTKLIINRQRIEILDAERKEWLSARIYTDSNLVTYDKHIQVEDDLPIKNQDVIGLAGKLLDLIISDPDRYSVRIGTFSITPTGESAQAVIIEGDGRPLLAFDDDTFVPLYLSEGPTYLSNCKIDSQIANSEFEFPESYKLGFIYNHVEKCSQNSDCDDGNPDTSDRCENVFLPPICSHHG